MEFTPGARDINEADINLEIFDLIFECELKLKHGGLEK